MLKLLSAAPAGSLRVSELLRCYSLLLVAAVVVLLVVVVWWCVGWSQSCPALGASSSCLDGRARADYANAAAYRADLSSFETG